MLSADERQQLRDLVENITRSLRVMSGLGPDNDRFQSAVTEVGTALRQVEALCGVSFFPGAEGAVDTAVQAAPEQAATAAGATAAPTTTARPAAAGVEESGRIDEFFNEVAKGVVAAQQELDRRSESYLRTRSRLSPPSVFHIPKVTAEFSLAAEKIKGVGINFIVSAKSEQRAAMQQKLSFEIVSVPPPVDAQTVDWDNIRASLTAVRDDANAEESDRQIAQQLLDNHTRLFQIDLPTHALLLFSPKPEGGKKRELLAGSIDRQSGETRVLTTSRLDDNRARFRAMVERLADLVGVYSDRADPGNG